MNRRNFLKLVAAGSAAAAMPFSAKSEIVEDKNVNKRTVIGNVEERIQYDLRMDRYYISHDVQLNNGDIHGVDQIIIDTKPETLKQARKLAIETLRRDVL